VRSCKIRVGLA